MINWLFLSIYLASLLFIKGCSTESCEDQYNSTRKINEKEREWIPYNVGEEFIFEDSAGNQLEMKVYLIHDTSHVVQKENFDVENGCRWTNYNSNRMYYAGLGLSLNSFNPGSLRYDLRINIRPGRQYYYQSKESSVYLEFRKKELEWNPADTFSNLTGFGILDSVYNYQWQNSARDFVHKGRVYRDVVSLRLFPPYGNPGLESFYYNKEHGIIRLKIEGRGMYWLKRN